MNKDNADQQSSAKDALPDGARTDFEDWCCKRWSGDRGALTIREDGEYLNGHVEFAWCAWQAALLTRQAVPELHQRLRLIADEVYATELRSPKQTEIDLMKEHELRVFERTLRDMAKRVQDGDYWPIAAPVAVQSNEGE